MLDASTQFAAGPAGSERHDHPPSEPHQFIVVAHPSGPADAGAGPVDQPICGTQGHSVDRDHSASPTGGDDTGLGQIGPDTPRSDAGAGVKKSRRKVAADSVDLGQNHPEAQTGCAEVDARFSDPTVLQIVELNRMYRRWMKARNALILQAKAGCRALTDGDKDAAGKLFDRVADGKAGPEDALGSALVAPFLPGIQSLDAEMTAIVRRMEKLAKGLPVAAFVEDVTGFGWKSFAMIVGEAGDLSAYRTVSGVWKRLGLAVIDGERQRKVADAEKAIRHGYNPQRRSLMWNVGEAMSKLQRTWIDKETGEIRKEPGPYGVILEREKAKALANGCTPLLAERRAKRHMTKTLLRDLTVAWRRAVGRNGDEIHQGGADRPTQIAAE
jgi:hypothetical protein